jgi:hypothetical protein
MAANREKIQVVRGAKQMAFSLQKKANFLMTKELEVKIEALKIAADLQIAAEEKVRKLEATVAPQKDEIQRLLLKTD